MPKQVKMMILDTCPYCRQAFRMIEELKERNPAYRNVDFDVIEENREPEKTEGYDYWYVPTFFVGSKKIMEGVPALEKVDEVFREALKQ